MVFYRFVHLGNPFPFKSVLLHHMKSVYWSPVPPLDYPKLLSHEMVTWGKSGDSKMFSKDVTVGAASLGLGAVPLSLQKSKKRIWALWQGEASRMPRSAHFYWCSNCAASSHPRRKHQHATPLHQATSCQILAIPIHHTHTLSLTPFHSLSLPRHPLHATSDTNNSKSYKHERERIFKEYFMSLIYNFKV